MTKSNIRPAARPTLTKSPPSDVTARIGDLVRLPCEGAGETKVSMEWRVNGQSLILPIFHLYLTFPFTIFYSLH